MFSRSYAKYMQLAGSGLVKSVLQLLIDGNKHNKCVKWEKIFDSYKHEIMAKSFMKAVARNIYLLEMTQFQMVKCNISNNLTHLMLKRIDNCIK